MNYGERDGWMSGCVAMHECLNSLLANGYGGSFPGGKAVGAWNRSLTSIYDEVNNALSYTSSPPCIFMEHRDNFMHVYRAYGWRD
jgi:hypothetical protein